MLSVDLARELWELGFRWPAASSEGSLELPSLGALLDLDLLATTVCADLQLASSLDCSPSLAVTCLDQVGDQVSYVSGSLSLLGDPAGFLRRLTAVTSLPLRFLAYGPTRADIREVAS